MIDPVKKLIRSLEGEEFLIDEDRQTLLLSISEVIQEELKERGKAELIVICTHNSRRSQVGEVWLQAGSDHYNLQQVEAYSGGTEQTAFNPRMVKALTKAGFMINLFESGDNPIYQIQYSYAGWRERQLFSKKYNDSFNPTADFIAILVCDQADEDCPLVVGARHRFFVPYADPKKYDEQLNESFQYDLTVKEIGREFLFMLKNIKV